MILHDIVALQERQLAGRAGQIGLLKHRSKLGDTMVTDLETRATNRISKLATDNTALVSTNQTQAQRIDQLQGRTWIGRKLRKVRDGLAIVGGVLVAYYTYRLTAQF